MVSWLVLLFAPVFVLSGSVPCLVANGCEEFAAQLADGFRCDDEASCVEAIKAQLDAITPTDSEQVLGEILAIPVVWSFSVLGS